MRMSQRVIFKRSILIIQKLRSKPATFEEISSYLSQESEIFDEDFSISISTFSRDISMINNLFHINISYNFSSKKYELDDAAISKATNRLIETFYIFDALMIKERLDNCIDINPFQSAGTENLYNIIKAIHNKTLLTFTYQKFNAEEPFIERTVEPYGVKEFRNWWFLLGKDLKDNKLKNFGFDRMSNLKYSSRTFTKDPNFSISEYYKHSFGITVPENRTPEEIILIVTGEEINYIKTKPLHHSQKIIKEEKDRLKMSLFVYITWELVAELRGKGNYIKVISPDSLRKNLNKYKYNDLF
jgi:hypothetical protein